jgi:hypothetical protein
MQYFGGEERLLAISCLIVPVYDMDIACSIDGKHLEIL